MWSLPQMEQYTEALADTNVSIELNASSFKAFRSRARINLHLENFQAAVSDFQEAASLASADGTAQDERSLKEELSKAEVALKRSKTKDYYKILGVAKDCGETEIKKAYRRESLKHHPDKVRSSVHLSN